MTDASKASLETIRAREAAGVFQTHAALESAVDELLSSSFDRADIDLMATPQATGEKLAGVYISAAELPEVPGVPREAFVARDDAAGALSVTVGTLASIAATAAAFAIVASGGALAIAIAAAVGGGASLLLARHLGEQRARELEAQMKQGGLVLWVRVRSPEREERALEILRKHGAEAVRVHEIFIEKRLDQLPLSKLLMDEPIAGAQPTRH